LTGVFRFVILIVERDSYLLQKREIDMLSKTGLLETLWQKIELSGEEPDFGQIIGETFNAFTHDGLRTEVTVCVVMDCGTHYNALVEYWIGDEKKKETIKVV
jgi:hypothetical protein